MDMRPVSKAWARTSGGRRGFATVAAALLVGWLGTGSALGAEEEAPAVPAPALAQAKEIFSSRCKLCHGADGKGDGPGAAVLDPKPRNLRDPKWQQSVTDEYIEKIILVGGKGVGKSPMMPGNPDLKSKPEIVRGLRTLVRGFAAE